ncbi:aminotransferase class III-fold pyridoxal phosphate-dependent enzyme [Micromonospora sp. NPDC005215]|uniref:aminotransferase class III-fold pyridoxal phosphate-dependent enzyme n=1 Tax=Micromonospora sp. NPDC005215 TaxID=3157024 RepID=UPI0033BD4A2E
MRFGFLAHAVTVEQRAQVRAMALVGDVWADRAGRPARLGPVRLPAFTTVESDAGGRCTGDVRYLPHSAAELLGRPGEASRFVATQVRRLADAGAELVGLGGATSIVGSRGVATARRAGVAVTSGNSLTAYAAHALVTTVLARLAVPAEEAEICVVGWPGTVAGAIANRLIADGCRLVLVTRPGRPPGSERERLPAVGRATVTEDLAGSLARTRLVVAASSAGGLIDPAVLLPGTVVVDVALPRDVAPGAGHRSDILVLDGGLVRTDERIRFDGSNLGPTTQLNGCLAETVVLALDGRAESWSLGRHLEPGAVAEIGEMARRHGFSAAPPARHGREVPLERIEGLARWHGGRRRSTEDAAHQARRQFRSWVNPPLAGLYAAHGLDRVFVSGRGSRLTDAEGRDYLDFVAGFGSLNLGHNHPAVVGAVRQFLDSAAPTFVQYTSVPAVTARLAERLCELAPGEMGRVFFSNSGAEAVEAALKVARAATGRTRLVYTANSYHGKTFGALSVSGRESYQEPFAPLLPECVAVPYGDEAALRGAVVGAAAFIVEPVQGEGGVVLPPPGYLAAAARICAAAGAVLIVDEIQTGLGRTGTLFACEREGVRPDVLCLAKSLSGGLVPIGATLVTSEVWDAAYGSASRSLLHTSTFGGGNFASAAALATLDVLLAEDLPARAATVGARLRAGLAEVRAEHDFVADVRGVGLMNAIEFDGGYAGAMTALTDEVLTRAPGDLHALAETLPDDVRTALRRAARAVEGALGDLLCLRFVANLARDHRMLTFVTANRNQVVRIQPPLVLTEDEADRFVEAVSLVCRSLDQTTLL